MWKGIKNKREVFEFIKTYLLSGDYFYSVKRPSDNQLFDWISPGHGNELRLFCAMNFPVI